MKTMARIPVIALVGNPNSGKTTIFNGLTGSRQRIGNWPGVTVEKKEGTHLSPGWAPGGDAMTVVDLPGVYAVSASAEDERVARDFILSREADLIVNVLDATNLERNLYLTLALAEIGVPMVVVLTMIDRAHAEGIKIDLEALTRAIGARVVAVNGLVRDGVAEVSRAIASALHDPRPATVAVEYARAIEDRIATWTPGLAGAASGVGINATWLATSLLEGDPWITGYVVETGTFDADEIDRVRTELAAEIDRDIDVALADARYATIGKIAESVKRPARGPSISERIDRVVLGRFVGLPIFLAAMFSVFWTTITVGETFIELFEDLAGAVFIDGVSAALAALAAPAILSTILVDGVGTGLQAVAAFIPVIGLMFVMLALLEDSGYMARAAFIVDRVMRLFGLPGKSFVPMMIGFGCTVPAMLGTRTLESKRDRFTTIFMSPLMSCGARLPVYALLAAALFPGRAGLVVFALYLTGIALAAATGFLVSRTLFPGTPSRFILELPPYHVPRPGAVLGAAWRRLAAFLGRAGVVIAIAVAVLGVLDALETGDGEQRATVLSSFGRSITPVFAPFGITEENWPASVGIVTGVFAKEVVVGTLTATYAYDDAGGTAGDTDTRVLERLREFFSPAAAFAFLLFILIYTPCIAAVVTSMREMGVVLGSVLAGYLAVLAWAVATVFYQVAEGGDLAQILAAVGVLALVAVVFRVFGRRLAAGGFSRSVSTSSAACLSCRVPGGCAVIPRKPPTP